VNKMDDISNKTLVILIGVAIVVSLSGLLIGRGIITGMASVTEENVTGIVNLTVEGGVDITITDAGMSFGDIRNGMWNQSENKSDNITLQNVGTTVIDIDYWANGSLFSSTTNTSSYKLRVMNYSGCTTGFSPSYSPVNISVVNVTDLADACAVNDRLTVGLWAFVPMDESSGGKASLLYFRGSEAGTY